MKGRASFKHYAQKDVANARKAAARRQVKRRDWNIRATPVQPSGRFEVFIFDEDCVHACVWFPLPGQTVLAANLIPDFPDAAEAMAAYLAAAKPPVNIDWVHRDLKDMTYLHLMRLAPGVDYGITAERQLGPDGSDRPVPELSEHPAGSGGGQPAPSHT